MGDIIGFTILCIFIFLIPPILLAIIDDMKKIVFILAAVLILISCSQQEAFKVKHKDYSEPYYSVVSNDQKGFPYGRSLDTIKVSETYVIVAVYRCRNSVSGVVVGTLTGLN